MISDVATGLFIEKGFDAVSVAEIASRAGVSEKTVFNYFQSKECLVFDLEDELELNLMQAIRNRKQTQSTLESIFLYFQQSTLFAKSKRERSKFASLIKSTPALSSHVHRITMRYTKGLAKEIQKDTHISKLKAECLARFVLEGVSFASSESEPKLALRVAFEILGVGCTSHR